MKRGTTESQLQGQDRSVGVLNPGSRATLTRGMPNPQLKGRHGSMGLLNPNSIPWYTFEHKGCSGENIPNGNSFGLEHFLLEHHRNTLQGPHNQVRCHEFRSL